MGESSPTDRVSEIFVTDETIHGCAESTLIALQEHYGLADPQDSSMALALNGGVGYWGGTCGAITGAALAVGRLAGSRLSDHAEAKRVARRLIQRLMRDFLAEFGTLDCRELTGYDLVTEHDAFLEDGRWKTDCTEQLQFAIARLESLADLEVWEAAVTEILAAGETGPPAPVG